AVMVVEVFTNSPIALLVLKLMPKKFRIGTNAIALPIPPTAKKVERIKVIKKTSI
ncbi:hypothetical protein CMTB2_07755, partial [Caminibacter mediatlanticus TB-2]